MKTELQFKRLNELFGSYKAEWLKGKIFDFFTEPSYFMALKDHRPCVLQGGRGTGKTTVLRGLSYQGQYALHNKSIQKFDEGDFIGIYLRANTNHVRAFLGGGLSIEEWQAIFGHYFNIIICREIIKFLDWHKELKRDDEVLNANVCSLVAGALHIEKECNKFSLLVELIESEMYQFQSKVNNIEASNKPKISMLGDPIKILTENALSLTQFSGKMFYLLIDEYENFEDYQQQSLNTLIKHNPEYYTFKIGVRELGWRIKHTLNLEELLHDPADYVLINIEEKFTEENYFNEFAKNVCQQRIKQLIFDEEDNYSIEQSLPSITMEEEAMLLDVEKTELINKYDFISDSHRKVLEDLSLLYKYFISYWAKTHDLSLDDTIENYDQNKRKWDIRYDNYKYNMLFKIHKGRGKVGIQKYYSGWSTYIKLANGNIRYLMDLVYRAYEKHLNDNNSLSLPISYKNQTLAAHEVGKKNLKELEGLWKNGSQLTKLLLGFGRIFNVLISEDGKIAPEVNQIALQGTVSEETSEILNAAVRNVALIRIPGNKLNDRTSTREYMYTIHPIFAPYFVFSYRRKRRMEITDEELLGVIKEPKKYIELILSKKDIKISSTQDLPIQLSLFKDFYDDKL